MLYAQDAAYERIKGNLTDSQFLSIISNTANISSTILSFLFMLPTPFAVAGAITTMISGLSFSEKDAVLNSISNGLAGITKLMNASNQNGGRAITADVGFLVFDNLGFRTVSSRYPNIH